MTTSGRPAFPNDPINISAWPNPRSQPTPTHSVELHQALPPQLMYSKVLRMIYLLRMTLEYVDPAGHQAPEQLDPPLDNPLGPQDDIPSDDDLQYVNPARHQPAEQMNPPLDVPLGPQDDIPSEDDLEYVDPVQQRPAEDLDPAPPNHPAGLQNPAEQPPLELPIPPQLGLIQPIPKGRQPYLIDYPSHYLGPMTLTLPLKDNPHPVAPTVAKRPLLLSASF
ncbi:hypothetical protein E4T56_gene14713 [Termitomyces sp. T112]|nr:hypothetical protein E4T56_gene14713 [Termitomyces sp. T112]